MENIDPALPCPHPPGSIEKVAVLTARARQRMALFHPLDAVDCNARVSRGGHLSKPLPRRRPDIWRRLDEVATALRHGATYRDLAKMLQCSLGQVVRLVDYIEQQAG